MSSNVLRIKLKSSRFIAFTVTSSNGCCSGDNIKPRLAILCIAEFTINSGLTMVSMWPGVLDS